MNNISTGAHSLDVYMDGGLEVGKLTSWSSLVHNFRTGTMVNLAVGILLNNHNRTGKKKLLTIVGGETCSDNFYIDLYVKLLRAKTGIAPSDLRDAGIAVEGINAIAAENGWAVKYVLWNIALAENVNFIASTIEGEVQKAEKEQGAVSKVLLLDDVDLMRARNPLTPFAEILSRLAQRLNSHISIFNIFSPDARAMYRDVISPEIFLKVVSRTGYVPRSLGDFCNYQIAMHVLERSRAGFTMGYHMSNGDHARGMVKVQVSPEQIFSELYQ